MNDRITSTLFVDVDSGGQNPGWSEGAVKPEHNAVEIVFERRDYEDGLYYGPGLSRIVVDRNTGELLTFELYTPEQTATAKAEYQDRIREVRVGMIFEHRTTGVRKRVVAVSANGVELEDV